MSPPTKDLELTLEQRIAHGGHPVLRWNMDKYFYSENDPAGNIKADNKINRKIDGAGLYQLDSNKCGNDTSGSVYVPVDYVF